MKIVYSEIFLKEGLCVLGAELFALNLDTNKTFIECVHDACPDPDIILMEFCANTFIKTEELLDCPYPIIAYVFDITINVYLCRHLFHFFDYVFVDQRKSIAELELYGIEAHWLPLCIDKSNFRKREQDPAYDISFVGLVNEFRVKRKNLLAHIKEHYTVEEFSGVSCAQMQDIFSKSTMTLNENLFDGLTLRVLQGMAAGTLMLTEANMDSVDYFFQDSVHLVCYTPDNLIAVIKDILDKPDHYAKIAAHGQEVCLAYHTSTERVRELFSVILGGTFDRKDPTNPLNSFTSFAHLTESEKKKICHKKPKKVDTKLQLHGILHKYNHVCVYGGSAASCVADLKKLIKGSDIWAAYAACILGDITFSFMNKEQTRYFYEVSNCMLKTILKYSLQDKENHKNKEIHKIALDIYCHHALFYLSEGDIPNVSGTTINILDILEKGFDFHIKVDADLPVYIYINLIIIQAYEFLGKEIDIGFKRKGKNIIANTAFDVAYEAFENSKAENILYYLLKYLKKNKIAGELLPMFYDYVENNKVSDTVFSEILEVSRSYYDKDNIVQLIKNYKKNKSATTI